MIDTLSQIFFFCITFIAGFLGALMGIGGGIIVVPALTIIFGLPIKEAIAISIVTVVATSVSGGSSYVEQRITNIRLAVFLETSTTLGAFIGALLVLIVAGEYLYILFSFFAFYLAFSQILSVKKEVKRMENNDFMNVLQDRISKFFNLKGDYFDESVGRKIDYLVKNSIFGWIISFFAGLGSGLLGIGGGVFKVSAMNIFMNVPLKAAVATSKFMIGVTAATSAILYYVSGILELELVAPAALGTMLGATIGTAIMNKLKVKWLKVLFFVLMCYIGYNMLAKGLLLTFDIHLPFT
ncbi:MAG: sulfite exporter TauE/SafE family protein [Nitrososphaeria archaeon]|nr:sulfite exporter TauE/SafE family protein [Nitrososphaeria archaeon]